MTNIRIFYDPPSESESYSGSRDFLTASDISCPKTSRAISSTEFCQCSFDEGQIIGKYQPKSVWLFVHSMMMADCPTTGGYPKIGTVPSADLPLLVQCVPNKSRIRFRETTVEQAQERYRELVKGLGKIVEEP